MRLSTEGVGDPGPTIGADAEGSRHCMLLLPATLAMVFHLSTSVREWKKPQLRPILAPLVV